MTPNGNGFKIGNEFGGVMDDELKKKVEDYILELSEEFVKSKTS
jgi:hypothetical protein